MPLVWDYPKAKLTRSRRGSVLLLERLINFGPGKGEKIHLRKVKEHWGALRLFPNKRRLMELFLWGKPQS
ncbi:hypothetical protein A3A79_01860 [Candidatus Gottesmanbacteria bacterium RIFCSPLOWO2_01_FULL_43_11b]|uniref:Uncharacterized protein n=1 Tax=Candidatus Gottesmanbacteria bacterium RIFCSPLOWO2_01_FULL_43_11b TaxID=1798392 RepID=A0A1F6AH53_9BACT|nr:MAG: hypothetical protein A3A79_01860 [Candidatus Gottesmanbacteria bacterium RIFCSPLOWO2_01_FULL_43_11b]